MLSVSTQLAPNDDLNMFKRMLKSVAFAEEIIIFNMQRGDLASLPSGKTKIINVKTPKVVEEIRSRQISEAKGDWVLVMDFDEIVPANLAREIQTLTKSKLVYSAFAVYRDNYSLGMPLKHGGWDSDNVIRLFYRPDFLSWPETIHSTPTFRGQLGQLQNHLEHHKDASLAAMVEKTNRYSDAEAKLFYEGGLPPVTRLTLLRKPSMEFIRRYILKLGFLDGRIGLIQALYQSYSVFITYAKLYEKQKNDQ